MSYDYGTNWAGVNMNQNNKIIKILSRFDNNYIYALCFYNKVSDKTANIARVDLKSAYGKYLA